MSIGINFGDSTFCKEVGEIFNETWHCGVILSVKIILSPYYALSYKAKNNR